MHAIGNHAFEKLPFEYIARRQLHVLSAQLAFHRSETGAQFKGGNGLVVYHGNDAIGLDRLDAPRLGVRRGEGEAGEQAKQQKTKDHGVVSGASVPGWLITP